MRYIDAHNHLQDERLSSVVETCAAVSPDDAVVFSAVNGSSPQDWGRVTQLAQRHPWIVPNFGVHPWHIDNLPATWETTLRTCLDHTPSGVGEIGIDGWRTGCDTALQERIFITQLEIAADRGLPVTIHGLRRWGRLLDLLQQHRRPTCGFMLHSYGGAVEMIPSFIKLGAYFSCPGFFLGAGRERKLEAFTHVPRDRLLLETDAPDQNVPEHLDRYRLTSTDNGSRINHPLNISAVYHGVARLLGCTTESLCTMIEGNFRTLFAPVLSRRARDIGT